MKKYFFLLLGASFLSSILLYLFVLLGMESPVEGVVGEAQVFLGAIYMQFLGCLWQLHVYRTSSTTHRDRVLIGSMIFVCVFSFITYLIGYELTALFYLRKVGDQINNTAYIHAPWYVLFSTLLCFSIVSWQNASSVWIKTLAGFLVLFFITITMIFISQGFYEIKDISVSENR